MTIFLHRDGQTRTVDRIERDWLAAGSGVLLWADFSASTPAEARLLTDVFGFHALAVEDALHEIHHPKVEAYNGYLYAILHSIDFEASKHRFTTHDVDFFLGPNYLVTVSDGTSRSIARVRDAAGRSAHIMEDGLPALMHRLVDAMVDSYGPEVEQLEDEVEALEQTVIQDPTPGLVRSILDLKRDVLALRRVTLPQRDIINRFARREFDLIDVKVAYSFRDVYDHLVRIADESLTLQDRVTGLLEAHLTSVSNRLNRVMQILTVITTVLLPAMLLASLYGMNVDLPQFPGGQAAQFWWVIGAMGLMGGVMLYLFRNRDWL